MFILYDMLCLIKHMDNHGVFSIIKWGGLFLFPKHIELTKVPPIKIQGIKTKLVPFIAASIYFSVLYAGIITDIKKTLLIILDLVILQLSKSKISIFSNLKTIKIKILFNIKFLYHLCFFLYFKQFSSIKSLTFKVYTKITKWVVL